MPRSRTEIAPASEPASGRQAEEDASHIVRAYNAVVEATQIVAVRLVGLTFNVLPRGEQGVTFPEALGPEVSVPSKLSGHDFNPATGVASTGFIWSCELGVPVASADLEFIAHLVVVAEGLKDKDPDMVGRACYRLGRFASYPYFRALFGQITASAGLTVPPLPTLRETPAERQRVPTLPTN